MRSQNSAYPCSLIRDANAAAAWYANKGRRLKSDPIENDEDLRKKLRYIEESKSNVVQLYAIGRPPAYIFVVRCVLFYQTSFYPIPARR